MLKALVPKFRSDPPVRLRDITEKQVPAKLKPMALGVSCVGDAIFRTFNNANTVNEDDTSSWKTPNMNRFSDFESCLNSYAYGFFS